jgi:tetratricopeptide (TPR) repeat protein
MKNFSTIAAFIVLTFAVMTQGFQCGSPEFSGAKLRIQQKDYPGAIKLLEVEVKKNPTNEEAWFLLGELDANEGDYRGMTVAFNEALKLNNKHEKEIYNVRYSKWGQQVNSGVTYLSRASADSLQFYDMAINDFKTAEVIWPDTGLTYKYLGIAYNNKGDLDNALLAFKASWEKEKDLESLKRVGRIYFVKGSDLDTKFDTDNADSLRILKNLNQIRIGTHKNDVMAAFGAPDDVKKLEAPKKRGKKVVGEKASPKEIWTYKNLGLTLEIENDLVSSMTKLHVPAIDSTYHRQALVMYDSAETVFEQIKNVDPKDNDNLNMLLQAYVKSNRIKEAINTFQIAVKNDPNNKNNHYILGILYREDDEYQTAIDEFKAALAIDPEFSDASYDVGATLFNWGVDLLRKEEAKTEAKGEAKTVENPEYKKKFQEALPFLEKVSLIKKDSPQIFETLGKIYARLGQGDKATKEFDTADWLRKHYELKLGMKDVELKAALGDPTKQEDTTFENAPASKWTYDKEGVFFIVANGVVKDWTRTGK